MCGRFTLGISTTQIKEHFGIGNDPHTLITPRYNIAPSQDIAVVLQLPNHPSRQLTTMHWGLIPHWAKDKKIAYKMINARAETLTEKPAYRQAYQKHRCLIPADGFYEWKPSQNGKQPYYIHYNHSDVFGFAGLWEQWGELDSPDHLYSCTIITTDADKKISKIHKRMPVIMNPDNYNEWLDPALQDTNELQKLLTTDTSDLEIYPVTTAVNSPKNDGRDLVEKLAAR